VGIKLRALIIVIAIVGFCSPLFASLNKETVERVKKATVFIIMESTNNTSVNNPSGRGTCSGFVINDKETMNRVKAIHEDGGDTESIGWGSDWSREVAQQALLRTHTTVGTIRYLSEHSEPPIRVFSVGRVFRREALDATHLPEFTQVEGIIVEPEANFGMLIGVLKEFYRRMGFPDVRVRPAYFPYTEPSMEVEVKFGDSWLELGGSGIFRPEVTAPFGIDCPVLAWGLGLERLAMLRLGIKDIRMLYQSDLQWLKETI
jgi:phenylalanyl-tRNA synthetase alpha chain